MTVPDYRDRDRNRVAAERRLKFTIGDPLGALTAEELPRAVNETLRRRQAAEERRPRKWSARRVAHHG